MPSIVLIPLSGSDWHAVADNPTAFAAARGLSLGAPPELLQSVAAQTLALLDRTGAAADPWTGYLAADAPRSIVGTCGFTAPPDAEGIVEIAYFTFPGHEGRGVASAMALALVEIARGEPSVRLIRAHTLPEKSASTRILEKAGFARVGEVVDPEDGRVWRWERSLSR